MEQPTLRLADNFVQEKKKKAIANAIVKFITNHTDFKSNFLHSSFSSIDRI